MAAGFCTATDLAPLLMRVVERRRRLPRAAMEVLAYHQPMTRAEIEERRGDLFEKRRAMIEAWAGFAAGPRPG